MNNKYFLVLQKEENLYIVANKNAKIASIEEASDLVSAFDTSSGHEFVNNTELFLVSTETFGNGEGVDKYLKSDELETLKYNSFEVMVAPVEPGIMLAEHHKFKDMVTLAEAANGIIVFQVPGNEKSTFLQILKEKWESLNTKETLKSQ